MIAVIFEFTPAEGRRADYMALAKALGAQLAQADGFISIERFESLSAPGTFVSLSFWRDQDAVRAWRNLPGHRDAQARGRGGIFSGYRLRVAEIVRDYTLSARAEAPADSVALHG
jgi:heme-degrading monooxygenase HmoA